MSRELLETLLVEIEASTKGLREQLVRGASDVDEFGRRTSARVTSINQTFSQLGKTLRTAFAAFGVGFGASALVSFGRDAINTADQIGEAARAADFGAERFQRLKGVFQDNGVETAEFDSAMRRLNQGLGTFISTGGGPAAAAIKKLGLEHRITNGEIRTSEQLFDAVVERMQHVETAAERASLSAQLFGREAGSKLAPVIAKGADALEQAAQAQTGVFSDEQVAKADALNDAYAKVARTVGTLLKGAFIDVAAAAQGINPEFGPTDQRLDRVRASIEEKRREANRLIALTSDDSFLDKHVETAEEGAARERLPQVQNELTELVKREAELTTELERQKNAAEEASAALKKRNSDLAQIQEISPFTPNTLQRMPDFNPRGSPESRATAEKESREIDDRVAGLQEAALRSQSQALAAGNQADASAAKLAEAIRMSADQQIAEWERVAKVTPQHAQAAADAIAAINERAAADIEATSEKSKNSTEKFAIAFGSGLQRTLADAFRGVKVDFGDLLRSMAAELASSGLIKALGGLVAGKTSGIGGFFATAFKGFASGGRPPLNQPSIVGEGGPEIWWPDTAGRILSNAQSRMALAGAGGNVTVHQDIQFGNGPQYDADLMNMARIAAKTAVEAVMKQLGGRR